MIWRWLFAAAPLALCSTLLVVMASESPLPLCPIAPNLPLGERVRASELQKVGMVATFRVPEAAKRYKASIGEGVHEEFLFMKPVAAVPGDHVCHVSLDRVEVNGVRTVRNVLQHEIDRFQPPLWPICGPLADDEFFMMSMHLPNSFDSRHFGPIGLNQILGSHRSLILNQGMARL